MLFQVYGEHSFYQVIGWVLVLAGLIITNEIERRSKLGGYFFFLALPAALTVLFYCYLRRSRSWRILGS